MEYKIREKEEVMINASENVDNIKFCPHIEVHAQRKFDDDDCEFINTLEFRCLVCQKNFDILILVN